MDRLPPVYALTGNRSHNLLMYWNHTPITPEQPGQGFPDFIAEETEALRSWGRGLRSQSQFLRSRGSWSPEPPLISTLLYSAGSELEPRCFDFLLPFGYISYFLWSTISVLLQKKINHKGRGVTFSVCYCHLMNCITIKIAFKYNYVCQQVIMQVCVIFLNNSKIWDCICIKQVIWNFS